MKFNTHHFPVGTIFTLNDDVMRHDEPGFPKQWMCLGLSRNGCDSYVIKTGVQNVELSRGHVIDYAFNLQHVKAILQRGDGKVIIDHHYYGMTMSDRMREDIKLALYKPNQPKPYKGYHSTYMPRAFVQNEVCKVVPGQTINMDGLMGAALSNTWAHRVDTDHKHFFIHHINVKRLRKWLKANCNRFLVNVQEAAEEERKEYEADYFRDADENWLRNNEVEENLDNDEAKRQDEEGFNAETEIEISAQYGGDERLASDDPIGGCDRVD